MKEPPPPVELSLNILKFDGRAIALITLVKKASSSLSTSHGIPSYLMTSHLFDDVTRYLTTSHVSRLVKRASNIVRLAPRVWYSGRISCLVLSVL